jgi:hypothetical protein
MFSYWLSRNRDDSGRTPQVIATFNHVYGHFTNTMLHDAGYIGDDWFVRPEMNGVIRYFYNEGDDEHSIVWADTVEELAQRCNLEEKISAKERVAGVTVRELVKSFTMFTGETADNGRLLNATKGQNIGNLHNTGATQRAILKQGYAGPALNEQSEVTKSMLHDFFSNPEDDDENMYATMDVSGGDVESDDCPMAIWKGNKIIALKFFRGTPKELVEWIGARLSEYNVSIENFAFDATGIGYYLKSYTSGVPLTANKRPIQEVDKNGNPILVEQYYNLRSQLLGKLKVMFERGDITCAIDKYTTIPYGKNGQTRQLFDVLCDEINVFISTTRNKKIYYKSKDEYKAKFHSSPDLIDTIMLKMYFYLDARPKKQPAVEVNDDAYDALFSNDYDTSFFD